MKILLAKSLRLSGFGEKIFTKVHCQPSAIFVFLLTAWLCCCQSPAHGAQGWDRLYPAYPTNGYNDIFALSASNVFAVGDSGLIVHFDGSSWSEMQSPVNNTLTAIWGRNNSDIFAVGSGGIILHFNGSKWQVMDNPAQHSIDGNLHCVWGLPGSGEPVYAGGGNGHILIYSGGSWQFMDTPVVDPFWGDATIYGIWGTGPDNLYAVGWGYDGGSGGVGLFDIYLSYTGGNSWTKDESFPSTVPLQPESVMGFAPGDVYIGGARGVYRLDDGAWGNWQQILSGDYQYNAHPLSYGIWGTSNSDIWFTGDDSTCGFVCYQHRLVHYDGDAGNVLSTTHLNAHGPLRAISGLDNENIFIASSGGMILHARDGAVASMTSIPSLDMNAICGMSGDALFSVGDEGVILSYDGDQWSPMQSPTNGNLWAICGHGSSMFASGGDGTVLHYDGTSWRNIYENDTASLMDVACFSNDQQAYVVGSSGTILSCNVSGCTAEQTDGTTKSLYTVYTSVLGSFAAGEDGVFLKKVNNQWTKITDASGDVPTDDIVQLWGDPVAEILVATLYSTYTSEGSISRYGVNTNAWTPESIDNSVNMEGHASIIGASLSDLEIVGYDAISQRGVVLSFDDTAGQFVVNTPCPKGSVGSAWKVNGNIFMSAGSQMWEFDGFNWLNIGSIGVRFNSIGGSSQDNIVVTGTVNGSDGLVLRYNGSSWSTMESDFISGNPFGLVYVSENGQWIVATDDVGIARYDGTTWQQQTVSGYFSDIWGVGDKVFVVGNTKNTDLTIGDARILSSTDSGMSWQDETIPANFSSARLSSIWGAGSKGTFFAIGSIWDGSNYSPIVLTSQGTGSWTGAKITNDSLHVHDIWGSASNDVYVTGDVQYGLGASIREIHHFDGTHWERVFYSYDTSGDLAFGEIIGSSAGDFFAFGSSPLYKDQCASANVWQALQAPGVPVASITRVWGTENGDGTYSLYAITGDSVYRYRFDINKKCSSPWSLFLPAILSNHQ